MLSIRSKITAITIAAILTTVACVFVVSYLSLHEERDRSSLTMMNLIAQDTKKSLEDYTENIQQSVDRTVYFATDAMDSVVLVETGVAGAHTSQSARTNAQKKQLDDYLHRYSQRVQESFASVAEHTQGVVSYYFCVSPDISETEHGFFYSRAGKTGFEEEEPIDARDLNRKDKQHNIWYFTTIERGRPSWVGPYLFHLTSDLWVCSYVVPVYKSGTLIGILGMDIPVDTLTSQVRAIKIYDTGFACLLDEDGKVIYHPQLKFGTVPDFKDFSVDDELFNQESNGDTLIRYTSGGEERQMSFCTLSSGMKLITSAPISEINASWIRLIRNTLLTAFFILVIFAVLVMFVMRYITKPLLKLTDASRHLANADYDVELDYRNKDEIGTLTTAFSNMRDQIEKDIEDLNHRIYSDYLTDLPNMRYFFDLAEEERGRRLNDGLHPVMLYFDLIGMKHYNRQYGFVEGDKLLCAVGEILVRHYGEKCMCRYSEDHFAAVSDEEHFEETLEKVFLDCKAANDGNSLPVRVGVYPDSMEAVSVSIACDRAKFACDRNRGSYVSRFEIFDIDMRRQLEDLRYIINHLDRAIEERWIRVWYQPIVRSATGKICDEEALSRWNDPVRGMLSPAQFIPILEEARLIYRLDLYVLDEILSKLQKLEQKGLPVVPHSLNLSRADFDSCDIVEEIRKRVDASGIDHSLLTIEVTESMVGSDFEFMKEQIGRFKDLGFKVWMDDFGSGYSALNVLQNIHFDLLKFDMDFMKQFDKGEESRVILTELVNMANNLSIETICEGVETAEQASFLKEIGCVKLQGYHFSKPMPYEEILELYRDGSSLSYEENENR